ncbi:MAG: SEC-C domain-containing protein, partial [Alphaproteobacteria bacterium]|nr:SEC-C domain-containing protein [Alphaproteobacteria bacterium]
AMLAHMRETVSQVLAHVQIRLEEPPPVLAEPALDKLQTIHEDPALAAAMTDDGTVFRDDAGATAAPVERATPAPAASGPVVRRAARQQRDPNDPSTWGRVSRNEPCPCGSGRKYKRCHGQVS